MCLIVVKNKADAAFSVEDFRTSYTRNSDGTGIMYVENGRIVTEYTCGNTVKEHLELYYKHMNREQFVLHHRMGTHGEKTLVNCHPFKVLSIDEGDPYDLYFAHNGVINMSNFNVETGNTLSDTHLFAVQYLRPIMKQYPDIIDNVVFQRMLTDYIGGSNKLAFLRNDGATWIFNKDKGDEHNGCWLSNKYSITCQKPANTYNYGATHGARSNAYSSDAYDYADEAYWRDDYNEANKIKNKVDEIATTLSPDEILNAIQDYAGMPLETIEVLVIEETDLAFDVLNFLSKETITKAIMNEDSVVIAGKLYDLLQAYTKKLAA